MKIIIDIPDEQYEYIKKSDKNTFAAVSSKECMLYAIKNGIPYDTSGDLISRSALKEDFADMREGYPIFSDNEMLSTKDIAKIIDTAPTVPERQKGEWKIQPHSMIMRCSLCGHEETAKDVGTVNPDIHFCSSCGAEMQTKEDTPCPCIDCIFKSTNSKKDCAYCEAWYKWSLE